MPADQTLTSGASVRWNQWPIIGALIRLRRARQLAAEGSPEAVRPLLERVLQENIDPAERRQFLELLAGLKGQSGIDAVCEAWFRTRHSVLAELVRKASFIAVAPAEVRVLGLLAFRGPGAFANESSAVVGPLVKFLDDAEGGVRSGAFEALTCFTEQSAINRLCEICSETRDQRLIEIVREKNYFATHPPAARIYSALLRNQAQELIEDGPRVAEELAGALQDQEREIRERAVQAIKLISNLEARDRFCALALQPEQAQLREIVLAAGFFPRDPSERALFFFMTEQFERYEALDFDQSLLGRAYELGDRVLRTRIAEKARRAGRTEWISILSSSRQERRMAEMTEEEWAAALAVLVENARWEELWRLSQSAPGFWSARLLAALHPGSWRPPGLERDADFKRLLESAARAAAYDEIAAGGLDGLTHCQGLAAEHSDHVNDIALAPNGKLATASSDKSGWLVDLHSPGERKKLEPHEDWLSCLAWVPDSSAVATGSRDKQIRVWDADTGKLLSTLGGHLDDIRAMLFSRDGKWLVSASADHTVRVWPWPGAVEANVLGGHTDMVSCIALSPDQNILATGSYDQTIRLWHFPIGTPLGTLEGHKGLVTSIAFSPDGLWLVSGSKDRTAMVWRVPAGQQLKRLRGHSDDISCLAISPDGALLATGSWDSTIRIWRLPDGELLHVLGSIGTMDGHSGWVLSVRFSADNAQLISAGADGTIRLWSMPGGSPLATLDAHRDRVTSLALTTDGRALVSGSWDGSVKLWMSEMSRLKQTPLARATDQDWDWVQQALSNPRLRDSERAWLEFFAQIMRWKRRHDIEIDEQPSIAVGEFDIEIEMAG